MSADATTGEGLVDDRPALASSLAVAGVAGVLHLVVAAATNSVVSILVGSLGAVGFGAAIHLVADESPVRVALGTFIALLGATMALVGPLLPGGALPTLTLELAAFGSVAGLLDAVGDGELLDGIGMASYGVLASWLVTFAVGVVPLLVWVAEQALAAFVPANAGPDVFGFAVLLTLAVVTARSALRGLPIAELAPKDDRPAIRASLDRADAALTRALWASLAGVLVGVVLTVLLLATPFPRGVLALVAVPAGTPILRGPLFAVTVVAGTVAVGVRIVRWTGGTVLARGRRGAAVAAGVAFAVVVAVTHPATVALLSAAPGWDGVFGGDPLLVTLVLVDVATVTFVTLALFLPALVGLALAPGRSAGRAFAAAGLVLAAMAAASSVHPLVTVTLVVGALVAWDLGEYAVGVGEEVGRRVDTGRIQGVHAAGSVGVGLVAFLAAGSAWGVVQAVSTSGRVALLALAAAVVGAFLLIAALRG